MRDLGPLRVFLRADRQAALVSGALMLLASSLGVLLPLSLGAFFHAVFGAGGGKDRLLSALGLGASTVEGFFGLFALLVILHAIASYAAHYTGAVLAERFASGLQRHLFSRQMHGSLATHGEKPVGHYLLRYSGDLRGVRDLLRKGVLQAGSDLLFLLFAFGALFWIDARLGAVVAAVFVISLLVARSIGKPMAAFDERRRDLRARALSFVSERLNAFRTVKAFNRETPETAEYDRLVGRSTDSTLGYERWNGLLQAAIPALFFAGIGLVLWSIHRGAASGSLTRAGDAFSFVLLLLYMRSPMRRTLRLNTVWKSGLGSLRKLLAIADRPIEERSEARLPSAFQGDVRFVGVSFAHRAGEPVLDDLDAHFPPHAITHLAGASGSGRSTVLGLIQRLHVPQAGTIQYDGIDGGTFSAFAIRKEVVIVSDDMPLLGNTVQKAIAYNTKEKNEQRTVRMLQRLGISFVDNPAHELDFPLAENAANLSRGARRMLQFARAFLTRKTVLLLDEPFKDLDGSAIARLIRELDQLRSSHTIVIAAANLPTALQVDHTVQLSSSCEHLVH